MEEMQCVESHPLRLYIFLACHFLRSSISVLWSVGRSAVVLTNVACSVETFFGNVDYGLKRRLCKSIYTGLYFPAFYQF